MYKITLAERVGGCFDSIPEKRVWRWFMSVAGVSLTLLLITRSAWACTWDYLIWMVRSHSGDPLYRFVENGKAGYINRAGKVVVKPGFPAYGNGGDEFRNGLLHISVSGARYVDTTGKLVIDKNYSSAWDFSEGLAAALPKDSKKWGYIDGSGEFVISPRFDTYPKGYVYSFSEGLAMIQVGRRYGWIDRSGQFVIPPTFLHGTGFHNGMARVVVEGPCIYFGDGPCPESETLGERPQRQAPPCRFAFIDRSGAIISDQRYDRAKDFSEEVAPVRVGEKWGYVDKKGQMVIKADFDDAEPFSERLGASSAGQAVWLCRPYRRLFNPLTVRLCRGVLGGARSGG